MDGKHSTSPVGRQGSGDWERTTLGTVVDLQSGGTPSKRRPDYWNGAVPWVSAKDMKRFRLTDTQDHLTESGAANGTRVAPEGTVLLLTRGMTLLNHLPVCVIERPMAFNQDVKALQATEGIDGEFLPYVILGNKQRLLSLVDLAGHGTGRLNTDELRALEILLPPLDEQRGIARILGALDDKIELNRRMSATLEAMARALFKSWFVDFEPVRAKAEGRPSGLPPALDALFPASFEASELGAIPSGWGVGTLGDVAGSVRGRSYRSAELAESDTALVTLKSFARGGGYRPEGLKPYTGKYKPAQIVGPGELVIACTDVTQAAEVIGRPAIVPADPRFTTLVASLDTLIIRPRDASAAPVPFLYCLTSEPSFTQHTYAHVSGTTVLHLSKEAVPAFKFALPPSDLLRAFIGLAGPAFKRMTDLSGDSAATAAQRDALLPRLVSGEVRVGSGETACA